VQNDENKHLTRQKSRRENYTKYTEKAELRRTDPGQKRRIKMWMISKETVNRLREWYPVGARVELTKMNDPYNTTLCEGCRGTVVGVDDIGTIHVKWDCGSSLGVVYGEDGCKIIKEGEQ